MEGVICSTFPVSCSRLNNLSTGKYPWAKSTGLCWRIPKWVINIRQLSKIPQNSTASSLSLFTVIKKTKKNLTIPFLWHSLTCLSLLKDLVHALVWNLICWQGGDHITHSGVTSACSALETIQRLSRCTLVSFMMPGGPSRGGCHIRGSLAGHIEDAKHSWLDLIRSLRGPLPPCVGHITCLTMAAKSFKSRI